MYKSEHIVTSKHYLILCVSSFATGILLAILQGCIIASTLVLVVFYISTCISVTVSCISLGRLHKKNIILPVLLAVFAFFGVFRVYTFDNPSGNSIRNYEGQEAWVYGTITSEPHLTSSKHYYTFELDVFQINEDKTVRSTIMMYTPESQGCSFKSGDNIFCWTKIENPESREQSVNHDYYTQLKGKNIFLTGNSKNINPLTEEPGSTLFSRLKKAGGFIRTKISSAVDRLFANDTVSAAILKGILIGDKSGFDDDLYDKFANSGLSHIVAVSGLHISILFSFLMTAFGIIRLSRKFILMAVIPFIILFMSASSFTPSVCRASIMIMITIASTLLSEEYNPLTSLFLALGVILIAAPYALFSKSLVLSFSATLGIFVYFRYINEFLSIPFSLPKTTKSKGSKLIRKVLSYLVSSLSLSCATLIGTAYFLLIFFGSISKVQFLTNLWIIPIVSVIFCLGYITCIILYIFPWLSLKVLKYPLALLLEAVKLTVNIFGDRRFSYEFSPEDLSSGLAAVYFGSALMIYMLLKAFHDIRQEKEIAAEKSDR